MVSRFCKQAFFAVLIMISIVFLAPSFTQAQGVQNGVLLDQFNDGLSCHDIRERMELLMKEITSSPGSQGIVLIQGVTDKPLLSYEYKKTLMGYVLARRLAPATIIFVRGEDTKQLTVQLWKSPPGTGRLFAGNKPWDYRLPETLRTTLFYKESWINEECPATFNIKDYKEFLFTNRQLRGKIVIKTAELALFRKKRQQIIREIGAPVAKELHIIFQFIRSSGTDTEYFFVGRNKP
jgi:hypothetical protein